MLVHFHLLTIVIESLEFLQGVSRWYFCKGTRVSRGSNRFESLLLEKFRDIRGRKETNPWCASKFSRVSALETWVLVGEASRELRRYFLRDAYLYRYSNLRRIRDTQRRPRYHRIRDLEDKKSRFIYSMPRFSSFLNI